jgi:hypothetical protein
MRTVFRYGCTLPDPPEPPECFLVEEPLRINNADSLLYFQVLGGFTMLFLAKQYISTYHPEAYRRGLYRIGDTGVKAALGVGWMYLKAETRMKRFVRCVAKVCDQTLVAPFRSLMNTPGEPKDYLFINDGEVVDRKPLMSLPEDPEISHIENDFAVYCIAPRDEDGSPQPGAMVRVDENHCLFTGDFTFSKAKALCVNCEVDGEKVEGLSVVEVDGLKLNPFVVGNKLFDRAYMTWVCRMKGVELEDKPYKVVFMDKTAKIVTFESTLDREKWLEVTEDALVVKSQIETPAASDVPEDEDDDDPLRDPEENEPTFTYWSALWKR